jgi:Mg2+/Co2+ transporter CorB
MSYPIAALIVLASLIASAFFAGAETALTAASRARMHALEKSGDQSASLVNRLIASRGRLISAMLLGGQIVNIAASAFVTNLLVNIHGDRGVLYATVLMTTLVVIFGEVLPKTIAIAFPDRVSLLIAPIVAFFVMIFWPIVAAVETMVRGMLGVVGVHPGARETGLSGPEELRGAVDILHREGGVERSERDMFGGLLELGELEVSDVMIHRTKMRSIDADLPPAELVREVLASPYTRLPLWRGQPDNIVGILHAKDFLRALAAAGGDVAKVDVEGIALEAWFIPATTTLRDQLQAFLRRKTHSALVVDEYGVVMGLVTLEDILEEIVGDIKDEHDAPVQGLRAQADGSVIAEGSVTIRELNRAMDWNLPDEEATTIAGLVIHEARAIPDPRQVFVFHGFRFEVLRKQRNRIAALRITKLATGEEKVGEEEKDG